jgi:YfiH family protein
MLTASTLVLPGVRHAFFTRAGGVSRGLYGSLNCGLGSKDERACVLQNRAYVAGRMGVARNRLLALYQAHTADCVVVDGPWDGDPPRADAMATKTPGLALGVSAADCTPVLFVDPQARVIGAAHAGWRGALGGVLEAALAGMERLGAKRDRVCAAIGPTIRQPSYEVGAEVREAFVSANPSAARFFAAGQGGRWQFDLPGVVAARLAAAGVEQVEDLGLDTYADEARFFSYRRMTHRGEADYGRHLHAIVLEG